MAKEWAKDFYNSKAWREVRETRIGIDRGLCQMCGKPGKEVDHIIELTPENINDEMIALNVDNLQTLCHACHGRKTRQEKSKKRSPKANALDAIAFDDSGFPVRPMPPLKRQ